MVVSNEILEKIIADRVPDIKIIAKKYFITGGSEDDLIQEGLIGLADGINKFDETHGDYNSEAFKSFILMCAKRQILDAIRKENSKKNMVLNKSISLSDENLEQRIDNDVEHSRAKTPEEIVMDRLENEETASSIAILLSKLEKTILDLYLDGCKQSEIAVKLNKSVKSIDNTLQRIKNKIKGKG